MPNTEQGPHKESCGYYSIVPEDLLAVGTMEPRGRPSFTLMGFEKGSEVLTLGANCRLYSGVPSVPLTEAWGTGTNLEPQPSKSDPETAPRCPDTCMDRQAVSSGLTSCLALYISQFHHLATSLELHTCTCYLTQSQETLSHRPGPLPGPCPKVLGTSLIW